MEVSGSETECGSALEAKGFREDRRPLKSLRDREDKSTLRGLQ